MLRKRCLDRVVQSVLTLFVAGQCCFAQAESVQIQRKMLHLRQEGPREWSDFSDQPEAQRLAVSFDVNAPAENMTLKFRQRDVKQVWHININGKQVGQLHRDENDMIAYLPLQPGVIKRGRNELTIVAKSNQSTDDIEVGELELLGEELSSVLSKSRLTVRVVDRDSKRPLPCRITILRRNRLAKVPSGQGPLQTTGASSNKQLAVRPGTVYSSTGVATIPLPDGEYEVFAGRGFEYSLARETVRLEQSNATIDLAIRREVDTTGYVSCDTHIHTLTHSGHGDSTVQERMITIAGEGIELPIATDHNVQIDHDPFAREMKVRRYFTPVIGNEVTTKPGHFNIFPVRKGAKVPDHRSDDWNVTFDRIERTPGVKVIILNHARDVHQGVRPFGPDLFNDAVGVNVKGWKLRANAMEVINSGATQTDSMQLIHDWMTLLNRGHQMTPVGCSDSHDVARHFVGQARTYIRCDDRDPSNIDVDAAINSFLQGQVQVSYGLLTKIRVNGRYTSGELARTPDDDVDVRIEVHAPHWIQASKVTLYANGVPVREAETVANEDGAMPLGMQWVGHWKIPKPKHDVHLCAVAEGPGIEGQFWKTAKSYQPTSPVWTPHVIGCSGAVWLDVDEDGRRTTAYDYARQIHAAHSRNLAKGLAALRGFDEAVASQVAHLYQESGVSLVSADSSKLILKSSLATRSGFRKYIEAWRRVLGN